MTHVNVSQYRDRTFVACVFTMFAIAAKDVAFPISATGGYTGRMAASHDLLTNKCKDCGNDDEGPHLGNAIDPLDQPTQGTE